jgi:hypothetical protein
MRMFYAFKTRGTASLRRLSTAGRSKVLTPYVQGVGEKVRRVGASGACGA